MLRTEHIRTNSDYSICGISITYLLKVWLPPHASGMWLSNQTSYEPIEPGLIKQMVENVPVLKNVGEDVGDNEMASEKTNPPTLPASPTSMPHRRAGLSYIYARVFTVKQVHS